MLDISIIVPIYCKTEESVSWLYDCLLSALEQNCQVVAYNDGSEANIFGVIEELLLAYSNLTFLNGSSNMGVSHARNMCVRAVKTNLIFPLDCDDILEEGAIAKLWEAYNGVPLYSDISKFGVEEEAHFAMLDFNCDHVRQYVGFTSVNVLHSKNQWKTIGGWDESVDFYEDGEYNARLYGRYCGQRFPEPLVRYRQHATQRTRTMVAKSSDYASRLLRKIRSMDMACSTCGGKKRRTPSNMNTVGVSRQTLAAQTEQQTVSVQNTAVSLPSEFEGKLLAQYLGSKGAGKHYYRGPKSGFNYRVQYGDFIYADPADVVEDAPNTFSKLVRVRNQEQPAKSAPVESKESVRTPILITEPLAATEATKTVSYDVTTMSVTAVYNLIDDPNFNSAVAKTMLEAEKRGLNRSKVITFLQSKV